MSIREKFQLNSILFRIKLAKLTKKTNMTLSYWWLSDALKDEITSKGYVLKEHKDCVGGIRLWYTEILW